MNLRSLYIAIPSIIIVLLNIMYGSAISWMLSIGIIACLLYFFAQIGIEQLIFKKTNVENVSDAVKAHAAKVIKKYKVLLSSGLLTIVFISSVVCIYRTTNPSGAHPWFFNNDYHAISNTGIAFSKDLTFTEKFEDSLQSEGSIKITKNGVNSAALHFSNFYEPVFAATETPKIFTPVNNIFPQLFQKEFSISNGINTITVTLQAKSKGFFSFLHPDRKANIVYDIQISSKDRRLADEQNIQLPYNDHLHIEEQELTEGKSLYNLLLNSKSFNSGKNESYAVLEFMLRQLGDSYLLMNYTSEDRKGYSIFPSRDFMLNGYHLKADGTDVKPELQVNADLSFGKEFYIGFHNTQAKNYITSINSADYGINASDNSIAFMYDYPSSYLLSSPANSQQTGNKNLRFVSNNNDDIIATDLREGFYFNNNGLQTGGRISGNIDYLSQGPNVPLKVGVSDHNGNNIHKEIAGHQFYLNSTNAGEKYLFNIRDFSQNGFHFHRLLLFATLIYLGMLALLIFFPGKNLVRIEPIIFTVVYLLLILRLILYWRLATFPPLENISKYELENTILNFDYRWGIKLPVPLTLIWVFLFLAILAFFRYRISIGKPFKFSPEQKWKLTNSKRINKYYAYFIGACLLIFFVNSSLVHIEILTRIISIIIPVAGYCYFAMLANKHFSFEHEWVNAGESKGYVKLKAYFHYFLNNPTFVITILTIAFFAVTDRGFAILFTLFILLKNIFFNFLKKPFDSSRTNLKRMVFNPNNYWIYGILSLIAYLTILSFKSLFYYLLTYKLIVIGLALLIPFIILFFFYKKQGKITKILGGVLALYLLLLLIPPTRNMMEARATAAIKHVQYRASIIHQPLSQLLSQNPYSSFQTQKIIETAENQWFINSYISKEYNNNATINLRPYSRVGVNYNTQTRDVVIARFVIGELGNFTMYLTLILTLLPLILYLISYRLTDDAYFKLNYKSYAGILPLLLFFTTSLFVWLTATNRFVFFGQDFPFLSLTSKLSVVLPLILFGITLTQQPNTYRSYQLNLQSNFTRYAFFTVLIAAFALTTIKSNELSSNNFSIIVEKTKNRINNDLNAVMGEIQDSLDAKRLRYSYSGLMKIMAEDKNFKALLNDSVTDNYTRSILKQLVEKPSSAMRIDNPLYITYNGFQYSALYNDHLYLHLQPVENKSVWNGSIVELYDSSNHFAINKWINGRYEILYPLKEKSFWLYHFANAIRSNYEADTLLKKNVAISLDYNLLKSTQNLIENTYGDVTQNNSGFRFSVIAADGNGNIRLMNDFVTNRKPLDPNDDYAIQKLQQKHFFFSNIRNERDQWGNSNLIALHLGPGSSVKPLTTAAIASQINAGWESLHMQAPGELQYESYAGFKLLKPWENDDHYRAGYMDVSRFLEVSSNFYQSAMIFLGSYPRNAFIKNNKASIRNVLSTQAGNNNTYPLFEVNGLAYHLPNYNNRRGAWPASDEEAKHKDFFGNENSLLANGLQTNAGLQTKTVMQKDTLLSSYRKESMLDSMNYSFLSPNKSIYYLWSMPEQSSLLQSQRSFKEPYQNFNIGLKTTTLGGYPYQVSAYKMLEMYLSLFTQNRNFGLSIVENPQRNVAWKVDTTWNGNANFNRFLAANIFKGMNDVIYGAWGTAHGIGGLAAAHPGYFVYAKTGTINEQGSGVRNSRRLVVVITNKNMQQPENIGSKDTKLYALYFAIDNNKDFDWSLLNQILNETMASNSFANYFRN
ncbi:hypothetical protein F0919_12955 [Taibaiella lutea]|uniref:Uncharacterized protein n=1 Tax=Taibaiella lutea TaxID=2608001 RepID=A0A5M6CEN2_9BACT|nr:hypothetical protein [Taibaiella lutea]KAA5533443.1 hypothetical protein F0919_12955 [Taibaiella lutea]